MTRKDFEMIAAVMRRCKPPVSDSGMYSYAYKCWRGTVKEFAEQLALENGSFQAAKFEAACGVE